MAATSKAVVVRAAGNPRSGLFNLCETGNSEELSVAKSRQGVIFWRGLDEYKGEWRADESTP